MTPENSPRLVAYQPDIAPNLGAMIRLSACMGTPLDIIEPCGFPLSVKSLKRTAMDYADIADMTSYSSWDRYILDRPKGRLVLMTTKATDIIWDFVFQPGDAIIMGRESAGVPNEVHEAADARIKLPLFGAARSLNVATSAAMALSEAQRQLREK
ncbi:MAG: tRNA (cytidine(34)-2'-O)-methyltransferase [Pseudomonadota bacterium]